MKCPRCESAMSSPEGRECCINGVDVLVVICPHCETVLGVVHHSHAAYFGRSAARESERR